MQSVFHGGENDKHKITHQRHEITLENCLFRNDEKRSNRTNPSKPLKVKRKGGPVAAHQSREGGQTKRFQLQLSTGREITYKSSA